MSTSTAVHRRGQGHLTVTAGKSGPVLWDLKFRGEADIRGHISGNDELITLAAAYGKAVLGFSMDESFCVEVGPFKRGRAKIQAVPLEIPPLGKWDTGWAHVNGHSAVLLGIDRDLRHLAPSEARDLARSLLARAESCEGR
jgi:hypothetical protein